MKFKLESVYLAYLGQFRSKSFIQGHFCKLEIKSFPLAQRLMGFYSLSMKILAPKKFKKTDEVCVGSLYTFLIEQLLRTFEVLVSVQHKFGFKDVRIAGSAYHVSSSVRAHRESF